MHYAMHISRCAQYKAASSAARSGVACASGPCCMLLFSFFFVFDARTKPSKRQGSDPLSCQPIRSWHVAAHTSGGAESRFARTGRSLVSVLARNEEMRRCVREGCEDGRCAVPGNVSTGRDESARSSTGHRHDDENFETGQGDESFHCKPRHDDDTMATTQAVLRVGAINVTAQAATKKK
jgi:hypothetical protein